MTLDISDPADRPWLLRRRRRVAGGFASFTVLVALLGTGFLLSATSAQGPEGYLEYVLTDDAPFQVIPDPPSVGQEPRTDSIVTGSVTSIALSLPSVGAASALLSAAEAAGVDPSTGQAQRVTTTGASSDGSLQTFISVALLSDAGYLQVLGMVADGSFVLDYSPPLLQLPADMAPGNEWQVEGITSGFAPFTFTGEVLGTREVVLPSGTVADPDACVDVRTRLDQQVPGADGYVVEQVAAWCPGRHIVASTTAEGSAIRQARPDEPEWGPFLLAPLEMQEPGTSLSLPVLSVVSRRAPLVVPGGIVVINDFLGDLIYVTATEPPSGEPVSTSFVQWMQHPGGAILGAAADDDRIVITTSQRKVIAFDHAGRMLWTHDVADVAAGSPILADDAVIVALVDGSVRALDAASGEPVWGHRLSDVVTEAPVATGDMVWVGDTAGYILGVGTDGVVRWAGGLDSVSAPLSPVDDSRVLVPQSSGIMTLLDSEGFEVWSASEPDGTVNAVAAQWGDVLAVPTTAGLLGLDAQTGERLWLLPEFTAAHVGPDGWVADRGQVARVGPDGSVLRVQALADPDGSTPLAAYVVRMGDQLVAVTSAGLVVYLAQAADE